MGRRGPGPARPARQRRCHQGSALTGVDAAPLAGKPLDGSPGSGPEGDVGQPGPPRSPTDPRRRWYQTAIAALLVGIYLAGWLTYAHVHLPPQRYDQLPPGAVATKLGADFTLVSLTRTNELLDSEGDPLPLPTDAVWVVAQLKVTRHSADPYWNCVMYLVGEDHRSWEKPFGVSRPTENCVPEEAPLGQTFPIEVDFHVPVGDVDRILGVGLPQNNGGRDPLLTPPR